MVETHACPPRVRAYRLQIRTLMLAVLLVALCVNPTTAPPVLFLAGALALGVAALLAAMLLGAIGFGFVAAVTKAVEFVSRSARWPDQAGS